MKLIFQNSRCGERVISYPQNVEDAIKDIKQFLDDHGFISFYTRVWDENGRIKIDVGSWSEFFFLEGATLKDFPQN